MAYILEPIGDAAQLWHGPTLEKRASLVVKVFAD